MSIGIREGATLAVVLALAAGCGGGEGGDGAAEASGAPGDRAEASAPVEAMGGSGMTGSLRVTRSGDRLTVKLEVLGVESGTEYPVSLRRGACGSDGEQVAQLDPPTVAEVGLGSSLTEVSAAGVEPGRAYSVRVDGPDGAPVACSEFEAPGG